MSKSNWKETKIFKHLETMTDDESTKIKNLLEFPKVMDAIELILDKGNTTPKDFTLHDGKHSFRVAEKMWELIPIETQNILSGYELGFLILSAYLHDIGMSPEFEKVQIHLNYLTTNKKEGLSEEEIIDFQKWIDNDDKTKSIDIRKEKVDDLKISDYILSYYIRSKHNDWSGEWIKENLQNFTLENYLHWTDDLINICKSHHYGIDFLKSEILDPKPISSKGKIHLRYIAMCLRVADVMENDPERTPEVILKHRLISHDSLKFWLKDRRFDLIRSANKFIVHARPDKAFLHKAIEETAQWIENELKLCEELTKIKPLSHSSFTKLEGYIWNIDASVHKDIIPKEGSYVYIQGAFRPNMAKILELLGGNQLYGNSIWAYRELLQNSFDAIKEKMAFKIANDNRDIKEHLSKLGDLYTIEILLEKRDDGFYLICKDQGVGMTKNIIEKFFLESGSSKRHEIRELERRCKEKGFNFSRTGQFGIGVLSYFMIADKIVVKTKRELDTGYHDNESVAWRFEINGSHDFGELSKYNKAINGTEIELRLKSNIEKDIQEWDNSFSSFLKHTIVKLPCNLTYNSKLEKKQQQFNFGWTNNAQDIKNKIVEKFRKAIVSDENIEDKIISSIEKEKLIKNKILAEEAALEIGEIIDFLFEEGEIVGLGKYRIYIPFFKLRNGNSFYYLKEEFNSKTHLILKINKGYFWTPKFEEINLSLKGVKIKGNSGRDNFMFINYTQLAIQIAYVELDIEIIKEANLSVSRHNLVLDDDFIQYKQIINKKVDDLMHINRDSFKNCYESLNYKYSDSIPKEQYWAFHDKSINRDKNKLIWKKLEYPLCEETIYDDFFKKSKYRGRKLHFMEKLNDYTRSTSHNWLRKVKVDFTLGIVDDIIEKDFFPILLSEPKNTFKINTFELNGIDLPEKWNNIILYKSDWGTASLLNINSKLYKHYDVSAYTQITNQGLQTKITDLTNAKFCFSFLLYALINYKENEWIGFCENKEELLQHAFNTLKIAEIILLEGSRPHKISISKWEIISNPKEIEKLIPLNEKKYIVEVTNFRRKKLD